MTSVPLLMHALPRLVMLALCAVLAAAARAQTIKIAIDAEFGVPSSTSAQAIYHGSAVAADEINAAGGVLGRSLEIIRRDNRAAPARGINNLRELAADPDVVAVMCGKYSPVVVEMLPEIHRLQMPYLDPWAAADPIVDNGFDPNFVFRLSLRDSWAMQTMLQHAGRRGAGKVGLLLPNTEWGRSNLRAAQRDLAPGSGPRVIGFEWYNLGDNSLLSQYQSLAAAGAQAIILAANEREGAALVNEMARLPANERLPIVAHWGITGGQFFELARESLRDVDLVVVQTFTFLDKKNRRTAQVLAGLRKLTGNGDPRRVVAPVGVAHAYDLVHLVARAITQAGSTDRAAIRRELERLGPYAGLTRNFDRPFAPGRHDALGLENVFIARYAADGAIERWPRDRR